MDDLRQISQTLWGQVKVRKPDFNLNPFEQEYFDKPHSAVLEANELGRNIRTAALTLGLMDELNKPATLFGQPLGYSVGDQIDMRLAGEYYGEMNKPYYQKVPEYVDQTFRESVKRINNAFNPDVDSTPVERGVDVGLGLVKTALNTVMTPMNVVTPASQDIGRKVAEVTGSEGTGEMLGEVLPFLVMPNPLAFFAASKGSEYATNKIMDYLESTNVSDANKERFGEAIGLTTFIATHRLLTKGVKYSREKIKGLLKKEIDTKVAEIPRTLVIEAVKEKQKEVDLSKRGEENIKQQLKNLRLDKVERTGLLKQLEEQKAKTIELQKSLDEVVKTEGIKPEEYKESLNFKLKNVRNKPVEGLTQEKLPLDLVGKLKTEIKEKIETPAETPKTGIEERTNKNGKKYYYDNDKKVVTSKKKFEEQKKEVKPVETPIEKPTEEVKTETVVEKPTQEAQPNQEKVIPDYLTEEQANKVADKLGLDKDNGLPEAPSDINDVYKNEFKNLPIIKAIKEVIGEKQSQTTSRLPETTIEQPKQEIKPDDIISNAIEEAFNTDIKALREEVKTKVEKPEVIKTETDAKIEKMREIWDLKTREEKQRIIKEEGDTVRGFYEQNIEKNIKEKYGEGSIEQLTAEKIKQFIVDEGKTIDEAWSSFIDFITKKYPDRSNPIHKQINDFISTDKDVVYLFNRLDQFNQIKLAKEKQVTLEDAKKVLSDESKRTIKTETKLDTKVDLQKKEVKPEGKKPYEMSKEEFDNVFNDIVDYGESKVAELSKGDMKTAEFKYKMEKGKLDKLQRSIDKTPVPSDQSMAVLREQSQKVAELKSRLDNVEQTNKDIWAKKNQGYVERAKEKYQDLIDEGIIKLSEGEELRGSSSLSIKNHKDIVRDALKEGKKVPDEVLKDYPDLQKQVKSESKPVNETIERLRKEAKDELNNLNIGANPKLFSKSVQIGAMHFKNGLVKFSEWSREMIKDLGDKVKPQLFKIWNEIRKFGADLGKIALDKIGEFVESRYNPARPMKMTQGEFYKFTGKESPKENIFNEPKTVGKVLNKFRGMIEGNATEREFSDAIKSETFRNPKDQARYKELKNKLIKERQGEGKLTRDEIIELENLKPAMELALNKINAVRGKPQVASKNPITQASYQVLFEKTRTAEQEAIALNKKFDDLITKARNSRGRFRLWKDDKPVLDVLSGKKDKSTLTPEEQILVDELLKFQKEAKPIMTDKNVLRNYDFPLLRRGFFEAWKYDGLTDALKEKWNQKNPREVNSILAEWSRTTSGEVFNPFALKRVGRTIPTMDLKKRLGAYTDIYTTKKHLDPILPTINRMIRALDKEGLKNNAKWIKDYADEILGKEFDEGWSEGNKKILSGLMTYNRLRYLWWNTAGAGVNWLAGKYQALMSPDMPIKDFLLGEARFFTPSGQKLLIDKGIIDAGHLESLNTYRGAAKELLSPYILYALGERHIQGALYLGKLTKEEFRSGKISPQRDREILEIKGASQGFYHKGLRPDIVRITLGRGAAQFRLWMPAVIESKLTKIQSTYNVAKGLLSKEKLTPEDIKQVKSLGKELSLVGSALLLYNSEVLDDDFKEQLGDLLEDFYSYGDPRSIAYTAKNIFPIASTVADLSTLLYNAVTQAKYKTNAKYGKEGELRAIGDVKKLLPAKRFLNQMGITDPDEQVKEGTFKLPEYKSQFQRQQYKSPFGE